VPDTQVTADEPDMNFNKKTKKAPPVEKPTPAPPKTINITNYDDRSTLIPSNMNSAETSKAYDFFKLNDTKLGTGVDFASYLKEKLGDVHYEKVDARASIRLSQRRRIEFTQADATGIVGDALQLDITVTNVGDPTYSH
jgi:hypothetical protein